MILPQIALAVALTAWLAYRSARASIEDVAALLRDETTDRIQENLTAFFELAPVITRLNQENVSIGQLDVRDLDTLADAFRKQLQVFETLGWVAFGRADGGYLSLQRLEGDVIEIDVLRDGDVHTHVLESDGTLGELLRVNEDYDPRLRPWYRSALEAGGLVWTEPYQWSNLEVLCLDAVTPVEDDAGNVLGVLDAGFSLSGISDYLATLAVSRTGRTFIVERSGALVGTSSGGVFVPGDGGVLQRVTAADSGDPLVREAALALQSRQHDLSAITSALDFDFALEGSRVFIQAVPLNPEIGLDWVIVVALPDAELMAHVEANVRNTVWASLVVMAIALLLSLFVTRWIASPLVDLAARARRIQHGDLEVEFVARSRDEIGVLTQTMGDMVEGLKERERIRDAFGRYVAEEVAQGLLNDPEALTPGGSLQNVTVMMTDLRGFSVLTARLGPAGMVSLLNTYLGHMTEVIKGYNGLINDFIGDAILVVFGAPEQRPDDTARALRCALAMQLAMEGLNRDIAVDYHLELEMGIGIDAGEVIVGNIGGEHRVKYGVIGDPVNMAARIESLTVGGQILVSRNALEPVASDFDVGPAITVKVKGRDEALTVFELQGARDDPELRVRSRTDAPLREVELQADLWVLSGKSISDRPNRVAVTRLGKRALELVSTGEMMEPLQNIKLRLRHHHDGPSGWYAKVRSVEFTQTGQEDSEVEALRALVAFTHEAELTLEERLRERLTQALAPGTGPVGELPSGPKVAFLRQLATAPIDAPADRQVTSRILVEMAAADGILQPTEREFVSRFIGDDLDTFESLMAFDALTSDELRAVSAGAVRETMLMLAWATALCDADLAREEVTRLAELATGLGIAAQRALELRGAAQIYLAEAAFSIVWPPSADRPGEASRSEDGEDDEEDMQTEYANLIERWVPDYGELLEATLTPLPPGFAPASVLELGSGPGLLTGRLVHRFPAARLHLVEASGDLLTRVARRFDESVVRVTCGDYPSLDLPDSELDFAVSAGALHALADSERRALYARVYGWLRPGAYFSYSDVFMGATESLKAQHIEEWRRAAFALGTSEDEWAELMGRRDEWGPTSRLVVQLDWLREAGFAVVDCTWRRSIWANVLAVKG